MAGAIHSRGLPNEHARARLKTIRPTSPTRDRTDVAIEFFSLAVKAPASFTECDDFTLLFRAVAAGELSATAAGGASTYTTG
jgi:hypothetical protein